MNKLDIKYAVWKEGKYYVAQCLNVDISSFGKNQEEAITNVEEAVELYLEDENSPQIVKIESVDIISRSLNYA